MICNTYKMFFGILADESKLNILKSLKKGPKTVSELQSVLNMEQSCVSHNLRKLKQLGFVHSKINGKYREYSIDKKIISPLLRLIDKHVDTYYKHYCRCVGKAKKKRWNM